MGISHIISTPLKEGNVFFFFSEISSLCAVVHCDKYATIFSATLEEVQETLDHLAWNDAAVSTTY